MISTRVDEAVGFGKRDPTVTAGRGLGPLDDKFRAPSALCGVCPYRRYRDVELPDSWLVQHIGINLPCPAIDSVLIDLRERLGPKVGNDLIEIAFAAPCSR